jgi:hypothetical protein
MSALGSHEHKGLKGLEDRGEPVGSFEEDAWAWWVALIQTRAQADATTDPHPRALRKKVFAYREIGRCPGWWCPPLSTWRAPPPPAPGAG